ncbi:TetR/AcrR family transcriptional regulator [Lysinibacter sp. HNR]|uniref:TetR/AcrR family transcriptional regulator n=1 Tax=Lysinibacter sp. HNR TaxID=3031408 RepID=UPI002434DB13|nr:TetR/AcrR family transcriptional regulator [Lysinibacter sp. HNR]WGD37458.1 TetR/AcrR family transcriptional regulator [Lysinibacter sp. HNR]
MSKTIPEPRLRERNHLRTREKLIDAVLEVIAEHGVDGVGINRVLHGAGVARGTLYAHFPRGRDELLRAAYARLSHQLVARTRDAVSSAEGWRGQVLAHAREVFKLAADSRTGYFYNVSGPALVASGRESGIGSGAGILMIEETLKEAQQVNGLEQELDSRVTAILLVGALREAAVEVAAGNLSVRRASEGFERLLGSLT